MSRTGWLREFAIASVLTDADVELLERILVVSTHPAGHTFLREGDRADGVTAAMCFVLDGSVAVAAKAPAGGFGIQITLGKGEVFGTVALVADVPRSATCRAVTQATVAKLDRRTFDELFRKNVGLHARFQLVIARSLAGDLRRLRALLVSSLAAGDDEALNERFGG
jgi:CRP-like cAMP-binding protein